MGRETLISRNDFNDILLHISGADDHSERYTDQVSIREHNPSAYLAVVINNLDTFILQFFVQFISIGLNLGIVDFCNTLEIYTWNPLILVKKEVFTNLNTVCGLLNNFCYAKLKYKSRDGTSKSWYRHDFYFIYVTNKKFLIFFPIYTPKYLWVSDSCHYAYRIIHLLLPYLIY